jgi:hypothetical protein
LSHQTNQAFLDSQARISEQLDDLHSTIQSLTLISLAETACNSQTQTTTASKSTQSTHSDTVAISMRENSFPCPIWCSCRYHARQNISLFNILFIGHNASPFRPRKCSERSCKSGPGDFRARLTYYFPRFILSKVLAIHIGLNQYSEPAFSLTVRNVVPWGAPIFCAAEARMLKD